MMMIRAGLVPGMRDATTSAVSVPASSVQPATRVRQLRRTGVLPSSPALSVSACSAMSSWATAFSPLAWAVRISVGDRLNGGGLQATPGTAVAGDEVMRLARSPGSRFVVGELSRIGGMGAPGVEDGGAHPPGLLHLVLAGEQGGVAEHAVEQQPLVGVRRGAE